MNTAPCAPEKPVKPKDILTYAVYYNGQKILMITCESMHVNRMGQYVFQYGCKFDPVAVVPSTHMVIQLSRGKM